MSAPVPDLISDTARTLLRGPAAIPESIEGIETNAAIEAKEKGQPPLRSDQPTLGIIVAVKGNFKFFRSFCLVLGAQFLLQTNKTVGAGWFTEINRLEPLLGASFGNPSIPGSVTLELAGVRKHQWWLSVDAQPTATLAICGSLTREFEIATALPSIRGTLSPELPTPYGNHPSSLNLRGTFT